MGLFSRHISLRALGRNWALVYVGNLAGALIVVLLVYYGGWWTQENFSFAGPAVATADAKVNLSFETAFVRGILGNMLVCLAIWLAMAGRSVTDKPARGRLALSSPSSRLGSSTASPTCTSSRWVC